MAMHPAFSMGGELKKMKSDFSFVTNFFNTRYFAVVQTTFNGKKEYCLSYYANERHAKVIEPSKGKILLRHITKITRTSGSLQFFEGLKAPRLVSEKAIEVMTSKRNKTLGFEIWSDVRNYFLVANDPESLAYWMVGLTSMCGLEQLNTLTFPRSRGLLPKAPKYITKLRSSSPPTRPKDKISSGGKGGRRGYASESSDEDLESSRHESTARNLGFDRPDNKQRAQDDAAARSRGRNWQPPTQKSSSTKSADSRRRRERPESSSRRRRRGRPDSASRRKERREAREESRSPSPDRRSRRAKDRRRRREAREDSRSPSPDRRSRRDRDRRRRREAREESRSPSPDRRSRRETRKDSRSPSPNRRGRRDNKDERRSRRRRPNGDEEIQPRAESGRRRRRPPSGENSRSRPHSDRRRRRPDSAGDDKAAAAAGSDDGASAAASSGSLSGAASRLIAKADSRRIEKEKKKRLQEIMWKDKQKADQNLSGTQTSYDVATAQYAPSDSDDSMKKENVEELSEEDDDVVFQRRRQASMEEKQLMKSQEEQKQRKKILDLKNLDDNLASPLELSSDEETSPIFTDRKSFRPKKSSVEKSNAGGDDSSSEDDLLISNASKRRNRRDARRAKRAGKSGLGARLAQAKKTVNDGITADENFSDDWDD